MIFAHKVYFDLEIANSTFFNFAIFFTLTEPAIK